VVLLSLQLVISGSCQFINLSRYRYVISSQLSLNFNYIFIFVFFLDFYDMNVGDIEQTVKINKDLYPMKNKPLYRNSKTTDNETRRYTLNNEFSKFLFCSNCHTTKVKAYRQHCFPYFDLLVGLRMMWMLPLFLYLLY
jgi:hypothetical protein